MASTEYDLLADVVLPDGSEFTDLPAQPYSFALTEGQVAAFEAQRDGQYEVTYYYNRDGNKEYFTKIVTAEGYPYITRDMYEGELDIRCTIRERNPIEKAIQLLEGNVNFLAMMLDVDLDEA